VVYVLKKQTYLRKIHVRKIFRFGSQTHSVLLYILFIL